MAMGTRLNMIKVQLFVLLVCLQKAFLSQVLVNLTYSAYKIFYGRRSPKISDSRHLKFILKEQDNAQGPALS